MNKKSWILIVLAIVLGVVYLIHFTSWFKPKALLISHNERFGTVNFSLGDLYQLTDLRVVSLSELESNKYALPIWELKSESNSAPVKMFSYGGRIRGMRPVVDNARPAPLVPGQSYRLFIEAGSLKAQHDFTCESNSVPSNRARSAR
ncbi:MAG TPA: hypothetical protein VN873_06165 [Candidatus Angelobacter sp.]|nr:hypothetical protein [Candidatus Angelobacter sp.]